VHEASLARGARLDAVFARHYCLELGQALMMYGHPTVASGVLRAVAECFVADTRSTSRPATVDMVGGVFLRECYTQWALAAAAAHGERALGVTSSHARQVYALAVTRGVWRDAMQRPERAFLSHLTSRPLWPTALVPAARALEAAASEIVAEVRAARADHQPWAT
jgi:hypothetical protein